MKQAFAIKTCNDGRAMLNLGCGTKMNWEWNNLDFSPYARLVRHMTAVKILKKIGFLSNNRYSKLLSVDPDIIYWDLQKGIPFPDRSFDVVYHSHFLEHINKDSSLSLLEECCRILKPSGFIRVVVPDLLDIINRYIKSVSEIQAGVESNLKEYDTAMNDLFDQMVRDEATGTKQQHYVVRIIEKLLRGDAASTGELHRWMYDEYSLGKLLSNAGFRDVKKEGPFTSRIGNWNQFALDRNNDGTEYKPGSLYMEAIK